MPPVYPPAADAWAVLNLAIPVGEDEQKWWEAVITLCDGIDNDADRYPLPIGGQLLAPYCKNEIQKAILAMPGRSTWHSDRRIKGKQISDARPSYINALLIQSRGAPLKQPCTRCRKMDFMKPFPTCARLTGYFGGSCANCKWSDLASQCDCRDEKPPLIFKNATYDWPYVHTTSILTPEETATLGAQDLSDTHNTLLPSEFSESSDEDSSESSDEGSSESSGDHSSESSDQDSSEN